MQMSKWVTAVLMALVLGVDLRLAAADGPAHPAPTPAAAVAAPVTPAAPANPANPAPAAPNLIELVKLPDASDGIAAGGGGKYLIFHLKKLQQLAFFDVLQQKVVKYLPLPSSDICFAAGAQKLFIGIKDLKQIQRWDLAEFKLELTVAAPEHGISAIAIGCNSLGPVFVIGDKRFWIVDPTTLQAEHFPSKHWGGDGSAWGPVHVHVSYDGTAVVANGGGWAGIEIGTLSGGRVVDVNAGSYINGEALISGNGSLVFRGSDIVRSDLSGNITGIEGDPFPALDPAFSLAFHKQQRGRPKTKGKEKGTGSESLTLFANANPRPLLTFPHLPELGQDTKRPIWERVYLIPWANLLVTVGGAGDEIHTRKFDIADELNKGGIDYLFVESSPASIAQRGTTYAYEMKIRSKRGGVKVELQAGPPGMKVDASGKVQWAVPRDFRDPVSTVILQVSDASGQTIFHNYVVKTVGELPPAVAVVAPAPVAKSTTPPAPVVKPTQPPPAQVAVKPAPNEVKPKRDSRDVASAIPKTPVVKPEPPRPAAVVAPPVLVPVVDPNVFRMPEPFREFHAANGGRALVFYQQKSRQLAIYDTLSGKLTGTIPVGADNIRFACGLDCIIVALPDLKILQRYDLKTLARTKSAPLPDARPLKHIKMGNASTGPLFLYFGSGELIAVDATGLSPIKHSGALPSGVPNWWFDYRVSADGSTVVAYDTYSSPSGFQIAHLRNGAATFVNSTYVSSMATRKFTPTADGSFVLYEMSVYDSAGNSLSSGISGFQNTLPTSDPRFILAVHASEKGKTSLAVCTTNDRRLLTQVSDAPDLGGTGGFDGSRCGVVHDMPGAGEPRAIFLPDAGVLAAVPTSNDRFQLIKLDLGGVARSSGAAGTAASTLAVVSLPPAEVAVNTLYSYQIQTIPAGAGAKFKVESGPEGLTVSAKGLVTWKPSQRPIGGKASIILSVMDAAGHEVPHAFDIAVTRMAPGDSSAPPGGPIVQFDPTRIELPQPQYTYVPGLGGHVLLLSGNRLALLASDGVTIESSKILPRAYFAIAERQAYYVALCQEPRSIDVIDKITLKVIRSRPIAFNALVDLALHPTLPLSYVSYFQYGQIPRHRFMIFDEPTADAHIDDNWIGQWLAISRDGDFLAAGFQETFQQGHDIIDNPDRIWIVPRYGSIDVLSRFGLNGRTGIPVRVVYKENVGGNGMGIRLSPDGKRLTYLSHTGYPEGSKNLGGWDSDDMSKLPTAYVTRDVGTTLDLAFHPALPLAASPGKGAILFFQRETGERQEGRINDQDIAGDEVKRLFFAPDGKSIVMETAVQGIHYLRRIPLKLSPEEIQALRVLPLPDKPMQQAPAPAADPLAPKRLPSIKAMGPVFARPAVA